MRKIRNSQRIIWERRINPLAVVLADFGNCKIDYAAIANDVLNGEAISAGVWDVGRHLFAPRNFACDNEQKCYYDGQQTLYVIVSEPCANRKTERANVVDVKTRPHSPPPWLSGQIRSKREAKNDKDQFNADAGHGLGSIVVSWCAGNSAQIMALIGYPESADNRGYAIGGKAGHAAASRSNCAMKAWHFSAVLKRRSRPALS